jgi:hypothetical protein
MVVIPPGSGWRLSLNHYDGGEEMAKRKPFGGFSISFKGCKDTVESVFGGVPVGPAVMTKKLWGYIKRKRLAKKR